METTNYYNDADYTVKKFNVTDESAFEEFVAPFTEDDKAWFTKPVELSELTTQYLDALAKRLQEDTFSEKAKYSYTEAWKHHYCQIEVSALMFHEDGNDITFIAKECDSRMRNLEFRLEDIQSYAERLKEDKRRMTSNETYSNEATDPEITPVQIDTLTERINRLRSQYAYVQNCFYVWRDLIRPQIIKRTGYNMGDYKSKRQIDYDKKAKQVRFAKKQLNMDTWDILTPEQKDKLVAQAQVQVG